MRRSSRLQQDPQDRGHRDTTCKSKSNIQGVNKVQSEFDALQKPLRNMQQGFILVSFLNSKAALGSSSAESHSATH